MLFSQHSFYLRSLFALLTSAGIGILFGQSFIAWIKSLYGGQPIREFGPTTHLSKAGTPTLGGALILFSSLSSALIWCDLKISNLWLLIGLMMLYGTIGLVDDLKKLRAKSHRGLSGKKRLLLQYFFGLLFTCCALLKYDGNLSDLFTIHFFLPFIKTFSLNLSWGYLLFAPLVITSTANAVNLTDGLDGLVTIPMIIALLFFIVLSLGLNSQIISTSKIPYRIENAAELAVFCSAVVGGLVGFLWYNSQPASIFMGDLGSMSLGGMLGALSILLKQEITLIIVGLLFVIEALSVIMQVFSFKRYGKRIFKMTPIHHHFEVLGWPENKVVARFWIFSGLCATIAGIAIVA